MSNITKEIQINFNNLINSCEPVPTQNWHKNCFEGPGGGRSCSDIIAYQIGWGRLLIYWYECGMNGEDFVMPGDGFSSWDYNGIAEHFFSKYGAPKEEQLKVFREVVGRIIKIVDEEALTGNLDKYGVWKWCTLKSGKQWPLSKWVRVNTVAPYKKAASLIRRVGRGLEG